MCNFQVKGVYPTAPHNRPTSTSTLTLCVNVRHFQIVSNPHASRRLVSRVSPFCYGQVYSKPYEVELKWCCSSILINTFCEIDVSDQFRCTLSDAKNRRKIRFISFLDLCLSLPYLFFLGVERMNCNIVCVLPFVFVNYMHDDNGRHGFLPSFTSTFLECLLSPRCSIRTMWYVAIRLSLILFGPFPSNKKPTLQGCIKGTPRLTGTTLSKYRTCREMYVQGLRHH